MSVTKVCNVLAIALLLGGALLATATAGEGSIRHGYLMRGQILEIDAGNVVLCVGKQDGAEVGQVLEVVRHVRVPTHGKDPGPRFRRREVGSVRITALFDEHYATAQVVEGTPIVNDTVELEK